MTRRVIRNSPSECSNSRGEAHLRRSFDGAVGHDRRNRVAVDLENDLLIRPQYAVVMEVLREVVLELHVEPHRMHLVFLDRRPVVVVVKREAHLVGVVDLADIDLEVIIGREPERVVQPRDIGDPDRGFVEAETERVPGDHGSGRPLRAAVRGGLRL